MSEFAWCKQYFADSYIMSLLLYPCTLGEKVYWHYVTMTCTHKVWKQFHNIILTHLAHVPCPFFGHTLETVCIWHLLWCTVLPDIIPLSDLYCKHTFVWFYFFKRYKKYIKMSFYWTWSFHLTIVIFPRFIIPYHGFSTFKVQSHKRHFSEI